MTKGARIIARKWHAMASAIALLVLLSACGGDDQPTTVSQKGLAAPVPATVRQALASSEGEFVVEAAFNSGTAREVIVQLNEVVLTENNQFTGTLLVVLPSGEHSIQLNYYVIHSEFGRVFVAATDADAIIIAPGIPTSVNLSDNQLNVSIDSDGDNVSNLEELSGGTDPSSSASSPAFSLIAQLEPGINQTDVPVLSSVKVSFSEAIEVSTITRANLVVTNGQAPIAGSISTEASSIIFKPDTALTSGMRYTVTLGGDVVTTSGSSFPGVSWSFTTTAVDSQQLAFNQLPYDDAVDKASEKLFTLNGLESGRLYALLLDKLSTNLDMVVYDDPGFSTVICQSQKLGSTDESCVVSASQLGQVYVKVNGTSADSRGTFTLSALLVEDVTRSLPVTQTVEVQQQKYFLVSGLAPNSDYMIEATGVSDLVELRVSNVPFVGAVCVSRRNSQKFTFIEGINPDNQGCIGKSNGDGILYIAVKGVQRDPSLGASFTLNVSHVNDVLLDITESLPLKIEATRLVNYYRITGLDRNRRYALTLDPSGSSGFFPAVNLFSSAQFDSASHQFCAEVVGRFSRSCSASPSAEGELYISVDNFILPSQMVVSLDVFPWENATSPQPYSFTIPVGGKDGKTDANHFAFVEGLEASTKYGYVFWHSIGNHGSGESYSDDVFSPFPGGSCGDACFNASADGKAYFSVLANEGVNEFAIGTYLNYFDHADGTPYSGTVAKGGRRLVIESDRNVRSLVFKLSDMTDDVDLEVFGLTLSTPACRSSRGTARGVPLTDFCFAQTKDSAGVFVVNVLGEKANEGASFDLSMYQLLEWYGFGDKDNGQPFSRLGKKYTLDRGLGRFVRIASLEPGANYTVRLSGLSHPTDLWLYSDVESPIAGTESCTSTNQNLADEECLVKANAAGQFVIYVDGTVDQSTYQLDVTPSFVPSSAPIALGSVVNGEVASARSLFYVVSGLVPGSTHTILLTPSTGDTDLYTYDDNEFRNLSCYALEGGTTGGSCSVNANLDGNIFVRVYGYSRLTDPLKFGIRVD